MIDLTNAERKSPFGRTPKSAEARLIESKVETASGCWQWRSSISDYKQIWIGSRTNGSLRRISVHLLAAILWLGFKEREGLQVLHKCDNRKCFNPAHLFIGTQQDNMRDCLQKGRGNRPAGEGHYASKLSAAAVRAIRAAKANGERSVVVAQRFGIHESAVNSIARRAIWRSVRD